MILADVKMLWEEVLHHSDDITLTNLENKELSRRITTHIITVCEQLFLHYLRMVDVVRQRSIFTDEANLSRLKAQLTVDCTKYLNLSAIKRWISREIKASRKSTDRVDEESEIEYLKRYKHMVRKSMSPEANFSMKQLFSLSRPKKTPPPREQTIETDLQEINENMPELNKAQVYNMFLHQIESPDDRRQIEIAAVQTSTLSKEQREQLLIKYSQQEQHINPKSLQPNPNLRIGTFFAEDLGTIGYTSGLQSFDKIPKSQTNNQKYSSVADDLQKLLETSTPDGEDSDPETSLPPLIQALTYDRTQEVKKYTREKILMELEEEEKKQKVNRRIRRKGTEHAQPATVNIRVSKQMIARTADVRISDRRFIDTVYLQIFPTVYNHIEREVDSEMMKELDSGLSLGEELQEIYKELLNTIPEDYLLFDRDPMITSPAMDVHPFKCFASSILSKKKEERAINPELKLLKSEFGTERYLLIKQEAESAASKFKDESGNLVSVSDYLNNISIQGTDYLRVAFHLYDSEDEGDEAISALLAQEAELKQKQEMEIAEIRHLKEEFVTGSWNINSVMLGGLGKEPLSQVAKVRLSTARKR
ncbi:coiled-coil domain-containing protein 87 isoform X3 [Stegostoma tigrinum]|nr:coiled-coil domain-containing protein 87 isoform X3 [Stegostoma tigrinum]